MPALKLCPVCGTEMRPKDSEGFCTRCLLGQGLEESVENLSVGGVDPCKANPKSAEELLPLVYEELRRLAAHKMAREAPGQTWQVTALVHEVWLRLVGAQNLSFQSRTHFLAAAAEGMRRLLIDNARRKHAIKRGAGRERIDLDQADVAAHANDETLLAVNDALDKLAVEEPQMAELIKMRFFAGMTNDEAAQALGISERSAKRYWTFARAWLYREISKQTSA